MDLTKLTGLKKTGTNRWVACCPAHDDKTASLSIDLKDGKYLYYCHAGCDKKSVTQSLLASGALQDKPVQKKRGKKIVAEYSYTDEDGVLLYQCVRYEPKDFRQRQPAAGGQWTWNLRGVRLVPYNLGGIMSCDRGVVICEGEKDADRLISMGICATTSCGGAAKWKSSYNKYFKDKRVFIIPDNDLPGRKHAEQVASNLTGVAATIKIVELPGGEKSDVSDWLDAGGDKRKLAELIKNSPEYKKKLHAPEDTAKQHVIETDQPAVATVPSFIEWPDAKDNGMPLETIANLEHLMKLYGITLKYDVISKQPVCTFPGQEYSLDNAEECFLADVQSICAKHRMQSGKAPQYMTRISDKQQINPAKNWIESAPWDGHDYIAELTASLKPRNPKAARLFLERWMVSAIAGALRYDGVAAQGVLVLLGKQGIGKTSWFKRLFKGHEDLFLEGSIVDPTDRDSVKKNLKYWVVELGELEATLRRSDQSLRAFITSQSDEFRKPYARGESKYPRRTVFCGTVNEFQYQRDPEGNRRYWTVVCDGALDQHNVNVQQAWAQAADIYHKTKTWWLDRDELKQLNEMNKDFESASPIKELIQERFDLRCERNSEYTATQVLIECGYDKPNTKQVRECSSILRQLLGEEPIRKTNGRFFKMPAIKSRNYH